jgi:hypothetical protein
VNTILPRSRTIHVNSLALCISQFFRFLFIAAQFFHSPLESDERTEIINRLSPMKLHSALVTDKVDVKPGRRAEEAHFPFTARTHHGTPPFYRAGQPKNKPVPITQAVTSAVQTSSFVLCASQSLQPFEVMNLSPHICLRKTGVWPRCPTRPPD